MTTLGSNLDYVKVIKNKNIITVVELYSNQTYSGLGRSDAATLSANSNITVHNKQNLHVSVQNDTVVIKSTTGIMHKFIFNVVELEGFNANDPLEFAQELLK